MAPQKLTHWVDFARSVLNPRGYMESRFAPFYTENRWGDPESASGPGSNLARTEKKLPEQEAQFFGKILGLWKLVNL